jgi:hypothetical protein
VTDGPSLLDPDDEDENICQGRRKWDHGARGAVVGESPTVNKAMIGRVPKRADEISFSPNIEE